MEMNSDDSMSLSSESGWSSSDDSDIEELLQDDDVEMMSLLVDVQEIEDRAKLLDHRRGSVMGREYIYRNRGFGHEQPWVVGLQSWSSGCMVICIFGHPTRKIQRG
jgi:hypothetical protein